MTARAALLRHSAVLVATCALSALALPALAAGAAPAGLARHATASVHDASLSNTLPCTTDLAPGTAPSGPAVVSAAPTAFGKALVVGAGPYAGCSLYMLTSDAAPTSFGCSSSCAYDLWPALLTDGDPIAGPGVNPALLGTVTRTDIFTGETLTQATYAGHPLYRFFLDTTAGQTFGEEIFDPVVTPNGIWYLLSPGRGIPDVAPTTFRVQTVPLVHLYATRTTTTPYGTRTALTVTLDQGIGGLTFPVYAFSADAHHASACDTPACSLRWPAVLTSGSPTATGTVGGRLGTTGRSLGMHQVTFDGQPLYLFFKDSWLPTPFNLRAFEAHGTGVSVFGGTFSLLP